MDNLSFMSLDECSDEKVYEQLKSIVDEMSEVESEQSDLLFSLHENHRISGANLLHYLVLRSKEIRRIQEYLLSRGLSSLAHSEGHIMSQIQNVLGWLSKGEYSGERSVCGHQVAGALHRMHLEALFGVYPTRSKPHIMVTFSSEDMTKAKLLEDMLNEGMTVARINCAHDEPEVWLEMIRQLKKAMTKTGRHCKIYMDLAGPKIRVSRMEDRKGESIKKLELEEGMLVWLCTSSYSTLNEAEEPTPVQRVRIYIEPEELITALQPGEQVFFDDGKFSGTVYQVLEGAATVRITRIASKKPFLKLEKGVNLPDTSLTLNALTDDDKANIPFICQHADMVGYSFVSQPEDVEQLRALLHQHAGDERPAIILKIERLAAIEHLPALLLNGMKDKAFGVMIARGDLAVEIGFERLSEIQQEILWICEAAHTPVIWATQVLETLNKEGVATRSEITDAATSVQSECVMLNKGPFIVETIRTLKNILSRQTGHMHKKRNIMRPLGIAKNYLESLKVH